MPRKIEISHKTIIFTVLFLAFLWLLYYIRDIILQLYLALLITAILNPFVVKFSRYKIPRTVSIIVAYVILLSGIGFSVAAIVPPLVEQTSSFINNLPRFLENVGFSVVISDRIIQQLITQLGSLPAQIAKLTLSLFSNVLGVVAVLVFAFYLLSEREKLEEQLANFIGESKKDRFVKVMNTLEVRLGSWAIGQITLMFVVGLTTYIGLRLLGLPFALPLAILAGILEIVPYIGPILAAVPAVLIGFGISPILGFATAALAFLVQQMENYIFVPQIMRKSTGVNPVITLLALALGFRLAGFIGILIAVPVYLTIQVFAKEYLLKGEK
ncbi:hypothetical protein A2865_02250 [Candidatus Woesebacteria bacterium RIFCSPHIGHO2_01_FULL_39_17]|uniref:Permease n=3 Tax=Candidatus Woeseibacteriota TaxID=1752722 RepID=A0A0G0RK06_9BACT|nr:MAG: hypothetical protein US72_C0009G0015 [Microgenomates group bacterium GW2011_GWC1_38_12]KKQ93903.1 MAG: hypothetical protein UT19_C0006G0031 [Candidatus Woesebacteria bacterium GW2011_GWB1_39_10b]KKR13972.1 MAG: hypothetical protein UT40_C0007G0014 [Candidatus Woesebacteria bacterium GW2011_GWA1_39_21b]OGM23464.1 MAG: hypothetical protein A2865_02250 [Candidatus Woesebacteria bacterium RIFCSPHIGHO2_01_FULL_39_17]OGM64253.1 MAG: hypothetical protein A3A52_03075 [Candidatus Woesebacteria b